MRTPHTCPVCKGTGLVSIPPDVPFDTYNFRYHGTGPFSCRACGGGGIVWDEKSEKTKTDAWCKADLIRVWLRPLVSGEMIEEFDRLFKELQEEVR